MMTNIIGAILGCSVDMVGILHPFNVLEFVLLRWFRCFNVQACTVVLPEKWGGGEVLPPSTGRDTSHSFVVVLSATRVPSAALPSGNPSAYLSDGDHPTRLS